MDSAWALVELLVVDVEGLEATLAETKLAPSYVLRKSNGIEDIESAAKGSAFM